MGGCREGSEYQASNDNASGEMRSDRASPGIHTIVLVETRSLSLGNPIEAVFALDGNQISLIGS